MISESIGSRDVVEPDKLNLPWGDEIWHEEERWFTMAQLLWVKLFGSSMFYGQLSHVIMSPLLPPVSRNLSAQNDISQSYRRRFQVHEMELVMDPTRGILLIGEVYGRPGDRVWRPEQIYGHLIDLGIVLQDFLQREFAGSRNTFTPGYVLVLRDIERDSLVNEQLSQLNTVTRDELSQVHHHIDAAMETHSSELETPFHSYGHMFLTAIRTIEKSSQGELGAFRTPDEIYQVPRLPAWLR